MPFKVIKLNDGREIPQIGFGTWKIPKEVCSSQVDQAIDLGFDHIDTAQSEWVGMTSIRVRDDGPGEDSPQSCPSLTPSLPERRRSRSSDQGIRSLPKRTVDHYQVVWLGRQGARAVVQGVSREAGD